MEQSLAAEKEPEAVLKYIAGQIKNGDRGGALGFGLMPETYWFALLKCFLEDRQQPPLLALNVEALRVMASAKADGRWPALRKFVIDHAEELSQWASSHDKFFAERMRIFRGEDGKYYHNNEDGTVSEVIGPGIGTIEQVRLDYITEHILRNYGNIQQILLLLALLEVSDDFTENEAAYPTVLRAVLPLPEWRSLRFAWSLRFYDRTRTLKWRPEPSRCDSDWLAADLLAHFTDTLKVEKWTLRAARATGPSPLDADCTRQMDFALDARLTIGEEEEYLIQFEGRTIRWINGSAESNPVISIGLKTGAESTEVSEKLNRLMSLIVWGHRAEVAKIDGGISGAKRALPYILNSRSSFGLKVEPRWLIKEDPAAISQNRWLALAFYREAVNSRSVFYAFLNYWKIIERAFKPKKARIDWINAVVDAAVIDKTRLTEIRTQHADVASYLDHSCRNAIAHVFFQPLINPDSQADYLRISRDLPVVQALAKLAIEKRHVD